MEMKIWVKRVAVIVSMILVSTGCQKKTAAPNAGAESKSELHDTTKPLQAVDLVGYNGTLLRKSVERIKQTNDKHNRELKKTLESGPDQ